MKKYKIAVDVSPLSDGNSLRGVGYYTKNLLSAFKKIKHPEFDIQFITNKSNLTGYDLVHYPFFDPFKPTLPSRKDIPTIVTVHDLIPSQFKNHFPVGLKGKIYWQFQKYQLSKVDHIITVSEYSKHIIHQLLHLSPQKISVTLEAANSNYHPITNQKILIKIKNKYNLPDGFVLYVGDINWNKNVPTLVKACIHQKIPVVIVGSSATKSTPDHPWTQDILWLQSQKSKYLTLTGFIPDEDISAVYSLATLYCQPSYAEGFGLPVLEAMQCGCPVITSQESSLAEISGSAAIFFNPYHQDELENKLQKLFLDSKLQKEYSQLGLDQAKKFSWDKTAKNTLSIYQKVLNEKP